MGGSSSKKKKGDTAGADAVAQPPSAAAKPPQELRPSDTARGAPGQPSARNPFRPRLVAFYDKYNRSKLCDVDKLLLEWKGEEEKLFAELVMRYGPEPVTHGAQSSGAAAGVTSPAKPLAVPPADGVAPPADDWRHRFIQLFNTYDPAMVPRIDEILKECSGSEAATLEAFTRRYGPEPTSAVPTAPPGVVKAPEAQEEESRWKQRLTRFFEVYSPSKIPQIDAVLVHSRGREEVLMSALVKRYGPEPRDVAGAALAERDPLAQLLDGNAAAEAQPSPVVNGPSTTPTPPAASPPATKEEVAKAFRRRLSGYLGVRAPHKLGVTTEAVERYSSESDDLLEFLKSSFGPEPTEEEIRAYFVKRLERFYELHEPRKVPEAAAEMASRVGDEEEYMLSLIALHGRDPALGELAEPAADSPAEAASIVADPKAEALAGASESNGPSDTSEAAPAAEAPPSSSSSVRGGSRWWETGSSAVKRTKFVIRPAAPPAAAPRQRVSELLAPESRGSSATSRNADRDGASRSGHYYEEPVSTNALVPAAGAGRDAGGANPAGEFLTGRVDDLAPNVPGDGTYDELIQSAAEARREADELRRIAREQQQLLMQHVAEADHLRRVLSSVSTGSAGCYSSPHGSLAVPSRLLQPSGDMTNNEFAASPVDGVLDDFLEPVPARGGAIRPLPTPPPSSGVAPHPYAAGYRPPRSPTNEASFASGSAGEKRGGFFALPRRTAPRSPLVDSPASAVRASRPESAPQPRLQSPHASLLKERRRSSYNHRELPIADDVESLVDALFTDSFPPPPCLARGPSPAAAARRQEQLRRASPMKIRMLEASRSRKAPPPEQKTLDELREDYELQRSLMRRMENHLKPVDLL